MVIVGVHVTKTTLRWGVEGGRDGGSVLSLALKGAQMGGQFGQSHFLVPGMDPVIVCFA